MTERIWISWEWQRRSIELSEELGCKLFIIEYKGLLRYPISIFKSLLIYFKEKPKFLFVQNPSMILATLACIIRSVSNTVLIIDRHSNFLFSRPTKNKFYKKLFRILSNLTIKRADLTIVTNKFIANIVCDNGGKPFILPDKLPTLIKKNHTHLKGKKNILMISSFDPDEPMENVFQAMRNLEDNRIVLYVSGNSNKLNKTIRLQKPDNVVFTGFLPEYEFVNILFSVDAVMALTTIDHCMLCGCYEAIAAEKPLITSDKEELTEYFSDMIYVDNTPHGIADGIKRVFFDIERLEKKVTLLKRKVSVQWEEEYTLLEKTLSSFVNK